MKSVNDREIDVKMKREREKKKERLREDYLKTMKITQANRIFKCNRNK